MENLEEKLTALNQEQIGLLTVSQLKEYNRQMNPSERKAYAARISSVYDILKKELEAATAQQIDHAIRNAKSWEEVLICRGGVNMGSILLEYFEAMHNEHIDNSKEEEKFNPHNIV